MIDAIKSVIVLGASGAVGSLLGGLLAQQGLKIYFLSRTYEKAMSGLKRAVAQGRSEVISRNIVCGDYEHHLEIALNEADWIVECVTENLEIKQKIYEKIDLHKKPDAIVSSTTSSLPLSKLPEVRSENFKKHFLSTHFYNPPGKMLACEITSTQDTDPEVYNFMKSFIEHKLRRVVIPTKNVAGFAGNRIAFLLFNQITVLAEKYGVEILDYLIGPYTGRIMPPLATLDLVGLDIHKAIIENLHEHTHNDAQYSFVSPDYINTMIQNGCLGNKTTDKGGFYKKLAGGKLMFLDPATCDYVPAIEPHFAFVEKAKHKIHLGLYKEAFDAIKTDLCREAEIVMDILCTYISYSYSLIGEVTEKKCGIDGIDKVMSYGFNWAPPSLMVNMLGGKQCVLELLKEKKYDIPEPLINSLEPEFHISSAGKYFLAR
ncbi:MAG: 3-hydroxyacyl-CoA dehydrogenase family protein [Sedimentisphaerales bacterium]|nr:3-hydroxyacyl-CoA dehydrogenase family protein [Sedimentisphaerales bacterium]